MDRSEIVTWLESHGEQVHGVPAEVMTHCERAVRQHAAENAWLAAEAYVEQRMHEWEHQWGQHATESEVAKEVCRLLASELRRREPVVAEGEETQLAGADLLEMLEPEALERVKPWVREMAQKVEHQIWKEIVRFTRKDGSAMVKQGRVSTDGSWEASQNYAHKAAHVAELLIQDYERALAASRGDEPEVATTG